MAITTTTIAGAIAAKAIAGAAIGAAVNAGVSAIQGNSGSDILKSAGKGALTGGVTGGVFGGLGAMGTAANAAKAGTEAAKVGTEAAKTGTEIAKTTTEIGTSTAPTVGGLEAGAAGGAANTGAKLGFTSAIKNAGTALKDKATTMFNKGTSAQDVSKVPIPGYTKTTIQSTGPKLSNGAQLKGPIQTVWVKGGAETAKAAASPSSKVSFGQAAKNVAGSIGAQGLLSIASLGIGTAQSAQASRQANEASQLQYNLSKRQYDEQQAYKTGLQTSAASKRQDSLAFGSSLYDAASNNTLLTDTTSGNTGTFSLLGSSVKTSRRTDLT